MLGGLALTLLTIAGFVIGMDLQKSCRTMLVMNNKVSRIQTDASMHLINYAQSGRVRDLQKFRSTTSPLVDLARMMNEVESDTSDSDDIKEAFIQVGLTDGQASRIHRMSNYSRIIPFQDEEIVSWDYALDYHYKMFDLSRRLLRDHVHGQMTRIRIQDYVRELQELNHQIIEDNEVMEAGLVTQEERIGKITRVLLSLMVVIGFIFIGYVGLHLEKSWKRHERFLNKARDRYQDMFEQAGIGIMQMTPEGKVLWANPAFARILQYESIDDFYSEIGSFDRSFVDPERKAEFKSALDESGFVTNFMFRAFQKNREKIWLLSNASIVRDETGRLVCYEASFQDYTLYRQTNQELHYLTGVLRGMAESIYQLLRIPDFEQAVAKLMKILGQAGGVDRVVIYRNHEKNGKCLSDLQYEWAKHDSLKILNNKRTLDVRWYDWAPEQMEKLEAGKVAQLVSKDHEGPLSNWMKEHKSRVFMMAPVYLDDYFWGILGFENCSNDDKWSGEIQQVMKTIASAMGHFLQKHQMQRQLRNSDSRYHRLIGNMEEVAFQVDGEGGIQLVNPAWEKVTDFESDKSVGKDMVEFVHPDDRDQLQEDFEKILKRKEQAIHKGYRLRTRNGETRWLQWQFYLLDEGEEVGRIHGTMYDMTDQKKTESVMLQNKQRLEELIESSPMVITVTESDGKITLWNRAAEKTYGWKRNEVIGKQAPDVPDDQQQAYRKLLGQVLDGEQVQGVEQERRCKNGSKLYIQMSASPLKGADGKINQVITFAQDVSQAKLSKEAIRKSLKEKNVLLSEIHHRVKNNMAVISGLLSLKAQEQEDPKIADLLKESENRIQSMAMIHEKLYQTDTFAEIELGAYLNELIAHIDNHYSDTNVQAEVDAEEVYLEISQAVPCGLLANEVLTNCYKHAFPSGEGRITITLSMKEEKCELYIKDNGVGFAKHILEQDKDTSLGLNLIKGLSKQLKGQVDMGNDDGAYVRITFLLI